MSDADHEYEERDPRRDVHIDEERYEMFETLQESEDSPFYRASNHDLFMFTVGYGRKHDIPQSIENDEHAFFGRARLSEDQQAAIEAVAVVHERNVHVLRDQRRVYQIAEEYSNGGIEKLHRRVFGPEDEPLSELAVEIKEFYESEAEL